MSIKVQPATAISDRHQRLRTNTSNPTLLATAGRAIA
jgi:hypothetical protein